MTFIRVAKKATTSDQDAAEELTGPGADEPLDEEPEHEPDQQIGYFKALATGVRDWLTWCSSRIGTGPTYGLHVLALWSAGRYSLWVTWGVGLGLAGAVVTFMPREPMDRLTARIERRDRHTAEIAEQAPATPAADPLPALLWKLIGNAPGVHRKTLTQVLAEAVGEGPTEALTEAAVEEALTARGIPLRPSVRDARGKVNRGVHREDLEAWAKTPSPAPSEACATEP